MTSNQNTKGVASSKGSQPIRVTTKRGISDVEDDAVASMMRSVEALSQEVKGLRDDVDGVKRLKTDPRVRAEIADSRHYINADLVQPSLVRMGLTLDVLKSLMLDIKVELAGTREAVTKVTRRVDSLCFAVDEVLHQKGGRDD